ncbi:MAG: hypothetical protein K8953_11840, partial [Proteobacteria bacterium]|nr:hypothetical protein [Pseudomonadota bacterium]
MPRASLGDGETYIDGVHLTIRLHAIPDAGATLTIMGLTAKPLRISGTNENPLIPARYFQKDEIVHVVYTELLGGYFHVLGARLQTDAESVADEGYLRELDFTEPTIDAFRQTIEDLGNTTELETLDGNRFLIMKRTEGVSSAGSALIFPTAPLSKKTRFRCIFHRWAGQSVDISLPRGTARFGFRLNGEVAEFYAGSSTTPIPNIGLDGIYVLEVVFTPEGGQSRVSARMARWDKDTPLARVFGENGGYKPLSPTHRDETQTNNRVNIGAIAVDSGIISQNAGGGQLRISTYGDTQTNNLRLYHAWALVGDARKIGIHYGGSGEGGGGDYDDAALVASIAATQAFAATKGIRRWTRDAGDPNQYGELDMVLYDDNVYYAKQTHAGGVDFSLDNWALIDGTAIDHLATQDALDASRIKDWV